MRTFRVGITADVADRASVGALFDELHQRIPRLNHFVANAGTGRVTPFFEVAVRYVFRSSPKPVHSRVDPR